MSRLLDLMRGIAGDSGTNDATTTNTPASTDNSKKVVNTEWAKFGFAILKATDGYIKLPAWLGGLIFQWGKVNAVASGGAVTVTFPLYFPNAVLSNGATINNTAGNGTAMSAGVGTPNQTNMGVFHNGANSPTAIT